MSRGAAGGPWQERLVCARASPAAPSLLPSGLNITLRGSTAAANTGRAQDPCPSQPARVNPAEMLGEELLVLLQTELLGRQRHGCLGSMAWGEL